MRDVADIRSDIFPIVLCDTRTRKVIRDAGTGFRFLSDLLVTCWHCVEGDDGTDVGYAIGWDLGHGESVLKPLLDVCRDERGSDLATATIFDVDPGDASRLVLQTSPLGIAEDVATWGYPLTERRQVAPGHVTTEVNGRFLRGYVVRAFHRGSELAPTYELDMLAPRGISGAPLLPRPVGYCHDRFGRAIQPVAGVIFGSEDIQMVEHFGTLDEQTGERTPAEYRIVSFALAHHTDTLANLTTAGTGEQPLREHLRCA